MGTATLSCSRYISLMAGLILNKSELKALAAVDGTRAQAEMSLRSDYVCTIWV